MRLRALVALALAAVVSAAPSATSSLGDPLPGNRFECPRGEPDAFDTRRLEDKLMPRAREIAGRHDCEVRVVERNGRPLGITDDLRHDRVNVAVERRRVTRVVGTY